MLAKKALASQHVLDVAFGNAPRNAIVPDFSLRRGSAREARRYAQDDCHALGWDALRGQVVRLCNILTRFPGRFTEYVLLALKLKVQGRTIPKISRTASKISRTISKISRTNSKVPRNKGLASAPERKRH